MGFIKKIWEARQSEFINRRLLSPTGNLNEVDVSRSEGEVFKEGDGFTADNMNGLENRILDAFNETMEKSVYDTTENGIVDNAEKLDGKSASYYATATETAAAQTTANAAMPKVGGGFTGTVRAPLNSTSIYAQMYNSLLTNSDGSTNGAAGYFKFQLK